MTLNKTPIGTIQGNVHGGNFPVSGAQIYLFAAGQGGYGTAATSLITSGGSGVSCSNPAVSGACYVTTDANGNFALTGDYTCTEGQQVYMVGVGGNPGLTGTGINNTAIVQMAALGACPASGSLASAVPYLTLNEVTTVAFGYALSGFATTAYNVSSDASGETALANAFLNANNIVNLWYGQAATTTNWYGQGPASPNGNRNGINPQSRIYALANVLATCVNTTSASSTQCTNLFRYATTPTGTIATDEANAIFNIAHNQAQNVASIYNLAGSTGPFSPTLSSAPADWTMPVIYNNVVSTPSTGGSAITSGPYNIAFDASGNVWIGDRVKGVVEVGPLGSSSTINQNFGMIKGVAVSPVDGSIWASDYKNNAVYVMNSTGTILQTLTTDLNGPILTAFTAGGTPLAYEANETTAGVVVFDATAYSLLDFETGNFGSIGTPGWIGVDQAGQAWLPSTNSGYLGQVTETEKGKSGNFTFSSSENFGLYSSYSIVSDSNSNMWLASITGLTVLGKVNSGGTSVGPTYSGGGMNGPYKLAVDGSNNIWVSNANANTVSGFNSSTGTWLASSGFSTSAAAGTGCVVAAPDPSGNLWAANSDGSVTELVGLATPTAAPLYGGITQTSGSINGTVGKMP